MVQLEEGRQHGRWPSKLQRPQKGNVFFSNPLHIRSSTFSLASDIQIVEEQDIPFKPQFENSCSSFIGQAHSRPRSREPNRKPAQ